jgi:pilus assembly protein Flp/PilA
MLNNVLSIKSQKGVTMIEYALIAALNKFFFIKSIKSQKGVTMIEYALIAALVAVVVIGALTALGGNLTTIFTNISDKLAPAK